MQEALLCPGCGGSNSSFIEGKNIWVCGDCGLQFGATEELREFLRQIAQGDEAINANDPKRAARCYAAAHAAGDALLAGEDVDDIRTLAEACAKIGERLLLQNNCPEAKVWQTQALAADHRLYELLGGAGELRQLAAGHSRLANIAAASDALEEAQAEYEAARFLREKIYGESGADLDRRELFVSYICLGNIARARKDTAAAREQYGKALAAAEALAAKRGLPEDQHDLAFVHTSMGDLAADEKNAAAARAEYETALSLLTALPGELPEHQREIANIYGMLAGLAREEEDLSAARDAYRRSLRIWKELAKTTGSLHDRRGHVLACERLAGVCKAKDMPETALRWFEEAAVAAGDVAERSGRERDRRKFADLWDKTGDTALQLEQYAKAQECHSKSFTVWNSYLSGQAGEEDLNEIATVCYKLAANPCTVPSAAEVYIRSGMMAAERLCAMSKKEEHAMVLFVFQKMLEKLLNREKTEE